jgi:hypothetical protein
MASNFPPKTKTGLDASVDVRWSLTTEPSLDGTKKMKMSNARNARKSSL